LNSDPPIEGVIVEHKGKYWKVRSDWWVGQVLRQANSLEFWTNYLLHLHASHVVSIESAASKRSMRKDGLRVSYHERRCCIGSRY
jgi:hypothetical protein